VGIGGLGSMGVQFASKRGSLVTAISTTAGKAELARSLGARSLLVSHWDVSDEGTSKLMSSVFDISSKRPDLSHGQALQQAQLKLLAEAKDDEEAHPRYWAPFMVVGEPQIKM
jgi:CHAT domain-containing protein